MTLIDINQLFKIRKNNQLEAKSIQMLASLFWTADYHLMHAGSLYRLYQLINKVSSKRENKNEEKIDYSNQIILASVSIPQSHE